ncbi:hypothetical protein ACP70R_026528 [Stipagrostis hirtigluma subsp. patula]
MLGLAPKTKSHCMCIFAMFFLQIGGNIHSRGILLQIDRGFNTYKRLLQVETIEQ